MDFVGCFSLYRFSAICALTCTPVHVELVFGLLVPLASQMRELRSPKHKMLITPALSIEPISVFVIMSSMDRCVLVASRRIYQEIQGADKSG
jgi:hypothetical protein